MSESRLDKKEIGTVFQEVVLLLELKGENPFKVKAYSNAASQSGVVIELNTHPFRVDIDWRLCKYAKEKGVKIAINPDAYDKGGLMDNYFGVGIARKGWLEPADILNTMDLKEMKNFLKERNPHR